MTEGRMCSWGLLFDWDGVVVDSSAAHKLSWERLAEETGIRMTPEIFKQCFGMRNEQILPLLFGRDMAAEEIRRWADLKEEFYRAIIREEGLEPLPGVREFLEAVQEAGIPRAVASSTPRANLDCAIELLGLTGVFDAMVGGEDVARGKPAPDVFLQAGRALGLAPSACLVLEDAPVGIEAARAAGMRVVGVVGTHPADHLPTVDRLVERLDELDPVRLGEWMQMERTPASAEG